LICEVFRFKGPYLRSFQVVDKVDNLPERAKKDKSKAIAKAVIEAYIKYVD